MYETVTVDAALARGRRMLTYPSIGIFLGTACVTLLLMLGYISFPWILFLMLFTSSFISVLYYHFMYTRWIVWALENVRNVHELRSRARLEGLMKGSDWVNVWTKEERSKLQTLYKKFDTPDVFENTDTVPSESFIYYSRIVYGLLLLLLLSVLCLAIFIGYYALFLTTKPILFIGAFCLIISSILSWISYTILKKIRTHDPQIILNIQGLQILPHLPKSWEHIQDCYIIRKRKHNLYTYYLIYIYTEGSEEISLLPYNITAKKLEKLLRLYRGRYEQQKAVTDKQSIR